MNLERSYPMSKNPNVARTVAVPSSVTPIGAKVVSPSPADAMLAEIERLRAENDALKNKAGGGSLRCKVSEKGALSIYGLGRFPVTLYKGQWERLIGFIPTVQAFIEANAATLAVKGE